MKSCSRNEIRRCRPLLGTFVEIAARGKAIVDLERGIQAAFAAVAEVHCLMSFHDLQSDVSWMNRDAFPKGVTVHAWTWQVMSAARNFAQESSGVFDVAFASLLGSWRDISLRKNREVFFRLRMVVDLGGIAKGFAVDRAVGPTEFCGMLRVRDRAIATSVTYFSPGTLIDGRTHRGLTSSISVTVAARDCMTADALTKIVFALREKKRRCSSVMALMRLFSSGTAHPAGRSKLMRPDSIPIENGSPIFSLRGFGCSFSERRRMDVVQLLRQCAR
jgi:FAD:protein FMN transferase